jgi:SnoaL-like domain
MSLPALGDRDFALTTRATAALPGLDENVNKARSRGLMRLFEFVDTISGVQHLEGQMSTKNVTGNLADHLAVRDLLDRYSDAINERDWVTLEQLFTAGGIWDLSTVDEGSSQIFEGNRQVAEGIGGLVEGTQRVLQMNHAPVIQIEGPRATARSTMHEVSWMRDGSGAALFGTYHDDIVREADGEWRFAKRKFLMKYFEATQPTGHLVS